MKITAILMLAACLQVGATGYTQTVSLSVKDAQLETVFREIRKQTGYNFIFTREVISAANPVNINVQNASLNDVLEICFQNQPLSFSIEDKFVVIKRKVLKPSIDVPDDRSKDIQGKVFNNNGEPIAGATITVKNTKQATATNERGEFFLPVVDENATLVISSIGHKTTEVKVQGRSSIDIQLEVSVSSLDETVVIAYGTTTRRLNTGSVGRITAKEIETQPVSNPLAALQGRVPGLEIIQSSGVPGSAFSVQIRGRSSLDLSLSQNNPLYIIDGVPFEMDNIVNQITSAANSPIGQGGGLSPFNNINPLDIENIEVLKDADATAIYGSRGANGVILITTKKSGAAKTKATLNAYHGWSKATRMPDMMNTQEYIAMRKEGFANDNVTPDLINAPDLLLWDTTRYTDLKELLLGGTAKVNDFQLSLAGGNQFTSFLISNSFRKETTVFSNDLSDQRTSFHLSLRHQSSNKKFKINFNTLFSNDVNRLISVDPSQFLILPPNVKLYDEEGNLNWEEGGVTFSSLNGLSNPLSEFNRKYKSQNEMLSGAVNAEYVLTKGLGLKISGGYSIFKSEEESIWPSTSIAPESTLLPSSRFANSATRSWIIEPQLIYDFKIGPFKSNLLLGSTFQDRTYNSLSINARNYTSDLLLYSVAAAGEEIINNNFSQYRYNAFFGRWNYNYENRYLINISGRRDGSSRFGPNNRFENFWAAGGAWIFSNEKWLENIGSVLSFGKIRGSYGITGNDQIGDYRYLDLWNNTSINYQNNSGLIPIGLFNPDLQWERSRKIEVAIELGLFKDKLLLNAAYYRHRSSNQLVNYSLPIQTGFSSIITNLNAMVQNAGLEFTASYSHQFSNTIEFNSSFNLTVPKNKLIDFPDLINSSYRNEYEIGEPLNVIKKIRFLGVNAETGMYEFEDFNHDGVLNSSDYQILGAIGTKYFGGWQNQISYKNISLSMLFQYNKQIGLNYLDYFYNVVPGNAFNQPLFALDRWQYPGDVAQLQRFTALPFDQVATKSRVPFRLSDGRYSDASFIRLKNISLNYSLPAKLIAKTPFMSCNFYVNGQNLLTITSFKGSDPESQRIIQLPPLRSIAAGFQLTF